MKNAIILMVLLFICNLYVFSQTNDYGYGNGSIIEIKTIQNMKYIRRIHNQRILIGDLSRPERLIVYNDPSLRNNIELFRLKIDDYINILEIIREKNIINKEYKIWIKISTDQGNIGWLRMGGYSNEVGDTDPYENNRWTIIERIEINDINWTVRRQEFYLFTLYTLNVRNIPGIYESVVLYKMLPYQWVRGFAVTEETDTIDGLTNHWVRVQDIRGRVGWIFAGYLSTESGGPTILTPENIIYMRFGYYGR